MLGANDDPLSPRNLRCTAFHEAGHAVAAHFFNIVFERVYILRSSEEVALLLASGGECIVGSVVRNFHLPSLAGQLEEARLNVIQALAGPISEGLALNQKVNIGPDDGDLKACRSMLKFAYCRFAMKGSQAEFDKVDYLNKRGPMEGVLCEAMKEAELFVQTYQVKISAVAEALLLKGELSREDVTAICERQ